MLSMLHIECKLLTMGLNGKIMQLADLQLKEGKEAGSSDGRMLEDGTVPLLLSGLS